MSVDDIPYAVWRVVQLTSFLESGLLPDPGGVLDQAAAFVAAACIVSDEKAKERERTSGRANP